MGTSPAVAPAFLDLVTARTVLGMARVRSRQAPEAGVRLARLSAGRSTKARPGCGLPSQVSSGPVG